MLRPLRLVLLFAALLAAELSASGQIKWTVTYTDNDTKTGKGFNDPKVAGSTTVGQLRQDCVTATLDYWTHQLDGRGTIPITWNKSLDSPPDDKGLITLGSFGRNVSSGFTSKGYFMGGPMYERGRSDASLTGGSAGSGQINFNKALSWHYDVAGTDTTLSSSTTDLVSVLVHEVGHGLAFTSGVRSSTHDGRAGNPLSPFTVGTHADWYNTYDFYTQQGDGAFPSAALINTDVTLSSHAKFIGPASTYTGGNENSTGSNPSNNTTDGLYFGGPFAREVFGGPVPLFSPATFQGGSSISHVNATPLGLMNWLLDNNTTRRAQNYEIAMMLDMGWNVYHWDNSPAGNWRDGVTGVAGSETYTLSSSKWRTDMGIVISADGNNTSYNTFSAQGKAPVLPPYGQFTSNIVLNFGGTSAYTSTNDLGDNDNGLGNLRLVRLNLNRNGSGTSTIQNSVANSNGTLIFGVSSDGTPSIITPKIVQQNSGAFNITTNLQITDTTASDGWAGLTVDGTGTGRVTLGGSISGTGSLTVAGSSIVALNRTTGNTYSGGTNVNAGVLVVNSQTSGSGTGSGAVVVNSGGTLGGNGRIVGSASPAVTINSGGNLSPGDITGTPAAPVPAVGTLTVDGGVTLATGSTFQIELNGSGTTQYDRLDVTGSVALNNATLSSSIGGGYVPADSTDKLFIIVNDGSDAVTGNFKIGSTVLANGDSFLIGSTTAYVYYDGNSVTDALSGGNDVVISFVPIPEPGAILGIAVAVLGVGAGFRRLRRTVHSTETDVAIAP